MRRSFRLLLVFAGLVLLASAWLWWNRPQSVDMAAYVPADSIIYLEANDLPTVLSDLTSTEAWRELAPASGLRPDLGHVSRLGRLSAWTGVGSAETVVLSRAQVAVAVLGFEAAEESNLALKISPRLALVADTHTGQRRTQAAVLRFVGDFARRAYGETKFEQSERDGVVFLTWSQTNGVRKIHAAVVESYVAVGTDEAVVHSCLSVKRGEQPSLADDQRLAQMRERVGVADALAFGYVPPHAAPKLSEIAALFFAGQLSLDANEQSGAAIILPQLAAKLVGGAAWSSSVRDGAVEDRYFLALAEGVPSRLSVALETPREQAFNSASFIPQDAHQLTRYNFAEPIEAWRGLNAIVSSQVDFTLAPNIVRLLDQQLLPYGVESPREFLRSVGPEVATARLDKDGERMVLVAAIRDEQALRVLVRKRFGGGTRSVRIGDAEMFTSSDAEAGAAAVAAGHFVTGDEESVRRCLQARAAGRTLDSLDAFKRSARNVSSGAPAQAATLSDDREQARGFISLIARQRGARQRPADTGALERALSARPLAVSETRLAPDGFERKTRSSFGQLGGLMLRFTSDSEAGR